MIFLPLLFYPGWFASFWWSSHLARHCIRSVEGCDSVLYCSQLLEDKALLASNKEASSIVPVFWLPTRLKMEASSKCKLFGSLSQMFAIVQISENHGLLTQVNISTKLKVLGEYIGSSCQQRTLSRNGHGGLDVSSLCWHTWYSWHTWYVPTFCWSLPLTNGCSLLEMKKNLSVFSIFIQ